MKRDGRQPASADARASDLARARACSARGRTACPGGRGRRACGARAASRAPPSSSRGSRPIPRAPRCAPARLSAAEAGGAHEASARGKGRGRRDAPSCGLASMGREERARRAWLAAA
eukprot:5046938-Pleurochrysis_carterae.AAC.3